MNRSRDWLIWIDLEMTGLDPDTDRIVEIATIVTDAGLETIAEGPVIAVHQTPQVLAGMDEWNTRQHERSGLTARVQASRIDERAAELATLEFLGCHVAPQASPMCGNSICQDRRFLYRHMPALERYFHYRNIDVSTIKELARRWAPGLTPPDKRATHLALDDIRESIDELRFYRRQLFRT
ncbi:MAG: oligoribonuclease [Gammaproteobacteria bacterium]|nr:oligoribonuclease [Gammaproteobacteria bacterium]